MDARLHRPDRPYLATYLQGKHVGLKTWYLVALPGACCRLDAAGGAGAKEVLLGAIKTAHDLHGVTKVLLLNHSDCGAYGGSKAFSDPTEEYRKHAADLRAARDVVRGFLSNLDVRLFFATVENRADGPFITFDEVR